MSKYSWGRPLNFTIHPVTNNSVLVLVNVAGLNRRKDKSNAENLNHKQDDSKRALQH
jgi:hypothetical protein